MSAVFITATGTDIGKTFVAAGLIGHLRRQGRKVQAFKPVATGFDPAQAASSDTGVLLSALGLAPVAEQIECTSPWRFAAPLSPDMAAGREGRSIGFHELVGFCRRQIDARDGGTTLIEGIGGVMVPLDETRTVLDWIAALEIPVLLVTGSYLGSLSHTLTAVDALIRRDVAIGAVVLNETPGSTVTLDETRATMANFIRAPIVVLPRDAGEAAFAALGARLD